MSDIKIKIGAEIAELESKLLIAKGKIKSFGDDGAKSIFTLTEKLKSLESAVFTEKSRAKIAAFNLEIQNTKKQIDQLSNVGKEGFDKVGNAIQGAQNPLTKFYSSIRVLAYAIPGIGIAGIMSLAAEAIIKVATATETLTYKQKLLNDVYESAGKAVGADVSKLELLRSKLTDLNISQEDRIKYAKQYNEVADAGNKIDLTQINNLDLINSKIAAQIKLIETRALAKAAEAKLGEQAEKVITAQLEVSQYEKFKAARKLTSDEVKAANAIDQAEQKDNQKQNEKINSDNLAQRSRYFNAVAGQNNAALEGLKKYNAAVIKFTKEKAEFDKQVGFLLPLINTDSFSEKISGKEIKVKITKPLKIGFKPTAVDTYFEDEEVTRKMISESLSKLVSKDSVGTSVFNASIDIGANVNVIATEKTMKGLRQSLSNELAKQGISTVDRILPNGFKIKIPVEIATTKELLDQLAATKITLEQYQKDIKNIIQNTVQDIASSMAESIGGLIAGTSGFNTFFSGIFKVLGSGLKELGRYLVQTYGMIAILNKIKFSNPAVGVAIGIALQILGAVISAKVSQTKAFASGVRSFSGGYALVGERGPERVFLPQGSSVQPNNELNAFSGSNGGFIAETRIQGQDLVIALRRAENTMSRNN